MESPHYINLDATCQMVRSCRKVEGVSNATHFVEKGPTDKYLLPLCSPCELCPKSRRRHQHILAGSIRPPHRLLRTQKASTDACPCAACGNVRCVTAHIFSRRTRWSAVRQVYLDVVEQIISKSSTLWKRCHINVESSGRNCFAN